MGERKMSFTLRMREVLRTEMTAFAEREKRSVGGLAGILLEWSFEQLQAAGSTSRLFGRIAKRLNNITSDQRFKRG